MTNGRIFGLALLGLLFGAAGSAGAVSAYTSAATGEPFKPGVYGRIEFAGDPPPTTAARPVQPATTPYPRPAIYLHVPPAHQQDWSRHCGRYDACKRPVYFVAVDGTDHWWEAPPAPAKPGGKSTTAR